MRTARPALLFSIACVLAALGTAHAGTVSVSYAQDARFTDAGRTPWDRESVTQDLTRHLQSLGKQYLPADRELKVEVLDIDLAGEMRPSRRTFQDVRVARGRADWPQITVRYSLVSNGQVLKSAEETISDMDYLNRTSGRYANESLHSEKRMLDDWFKARFVAPQP